MAMCARRHLFVVPLVAGLALMLSPSPGAGETPSKDTIDRFIKQLGSDSFAEREKASRELATIGVPALQALRQAAKSEDAEIRKRAEELLPRIEMQAESMRVLAPQRVHLIYKETPLREAVADFHKKSGYSIELHDPDGKLGERKLTLDTGATTFWHAFALFCENAGVSEAGLEDSISTPQPPGIPGAQTVVIRPGRGLAPGVYGGRLVLKDGKAPQRPTDDRSAARIRVWGKSDLFGKAPEGEIILALEVSLEPRLQWQTFQAIQLEKAVDDQDQKLMHVVPQVEGAAGGLGGNWADWQQRRMQMQFLARPHMVGGVVSQVLPLQLKKGAKEARTLKELSGVLTAQLLTEPQPLIVTDKLDQAVGKIFKGDEGGAITIVSVQAEKEQTTVRLMLEHPPYDKVVPLQPHMLAGPGPQGAAPLQRVKSISPNGLMDSFNGLSFQDDKGNALPIDVRQVRMQMSFVQQGNGVPKQVLTCTLVCPHGKEVRPVKAAYRGRKRATVEIPFAFKDIPLP